MYYFIVVLGFVHTFYIYNIKMFEILFESTYSSES